MKKPTIKRFSVVLPVEMYERVRTFAFKNKCKVSEAVRALIEKSLSK